MIGSQIIHSSLDNQLCQVTCMTTAKASATGRLSESRDKDTPGHPLEVPQPLEKDVVPMGVILMDVVIQELIHAHMAHVVIR